MEYFSVKSWAKWQSYRADRGQPPWIKVHRSLLRSVKWMRLTDAQRGQLVSLWMLAADKDGKIPNDQQFIKRVCGFTSAFDMQVFVDAGFMELDANMTSTCSGDSKLVTPQRQSRDRVDTMADAKDVINYLNQTAGRQLSMTAHIEKCLKREKCSVNDCKLVIDYLWGSWSGDEKMRGYVDNITPWGAQKFQGYLDKAKEQSRKKSPSRELPEHLREIAEMNGE